MEGQNLTNNSSLLNKNNGIATVAETWTDTAVNVVKFSHKWTISNFSFCSNELRYAMKSETFSAGVNDKHEWILLAYPQGFKEADINYLSVFLKLMSSKKSAIATRAKFCIVNDKAEKTNIMEFGEVRMYHDVEKESWGFSRFIERNILFDKANGLLPDDKLTILCEITVFEDTVNTTGNGSPLQIENPESIALNNLELLFDTQKFSDIIVTAGGRLFHVHKALLAVNSPVFTAMFEHNMEERDSNLVKIIDMEDEVLEEMLRFMYTGKVTNIGNIADSLLAAANKYQIKNLKLMCQESLSKDLTIENSALTLVLADLHNADWLKKQTIDFISMHMLEVVDTAGFSTMEFSHPNLVTDILRFLAMKRSDGASGSIKPMEEGEESQS